MLTQIIENITGAFSQLMTAMTGAIGSGFNALIYADPSTKELSALAEFSLVFLGLGLAVGLVWAVVRIIRR